MNCILFIMFDVPIQIMFSLVFMNVFSKSCIVWRAVFAIVFSLKNRLYRVPVNASVLCTHTHII